MSLPPICLLLDRIEAGRSHLNMLMCQILRIQGLHLAEELSWKVAGHRTYAESAKADNRLEVSHSPAKSSSHLFANKKPKHPSLNFAGRAAGRARNV